MDEVLVLAVKIVDQTRWRVPDVETVSASAKVTSLFEPHPDIVAKGERDVEYEHKANLATGRSGLVLNAVSTPCGISHGRVEPPFKA